MGYIQGKIDVNQYSFNPICFDNLIEEENPVRMINEFVNSLDLEKLNFKNAKPKGIGRPGYNPQMMLKLYLYGYFNGIRSSRKLAKECKRNIEMFWLLDKLTPDFRTISDFRKDNINNMKSVFVAFSNLCEELDLLGKEIVAIDGSKFRASNGRKSNYTKGKLDKQISYHKENIEKYMEILDSMDKEESEENDKLKVSQGEIKNKIKEIQKRIDELSEIKEIVEKDGEISTVDEDSRHMKTNNNGTDICHNTQIAVDSKNHLVVSVDVTSSPADQTQLYNMSKQTKEDLKVERLTVLADKGYWNGEDLKKCEDENITAIVSVPKEVGNKGYQRKDFKYDKELDVYICPMGNKLHRSGNTCIMYTNSEACKNCPNKDKCTKSKRGKRIIKNENEEYMKIARKRQEENMSLYKKRQQIVEHVFGTVKRDLGYTHFLLRRNPKVKGESFMHFLIYNMKRVLKIMKMDKIMKGIYKENKEKKHNIFKNRKYYAFFFTRIQSTV